MKNKETYTHQKRGKKSTLRTKLETKVAYMQKTWRTKLKKPKPKQSNLRQMSTKRIFILYWSSTTGHWP